MFVASVSNLVFANTNALTNLALASGGNFNVAASSSLEIYTTVSGSNVDLNKNGAGTLILGGANTFTGSFTVTAGVAYLTVDRALGGVSTVNVASGATLSNAVGRTDTINDNAALTVSGALDLSGGQETVGSLAGSSAGATLTIGRYQDTSGGLTVGNAASTTFAGTIQEATVASTGSSSFTKQGTGTLTLAGTNTFSGTINVNAGTLAAAGGSGAALGLVAAVNVRGGGTLLFGAANQVNGAAPVTLGTAGSTGVATLNANRFSQGSATSQGLGALTLAATASLDFGAGSTSTVLHFGNSTGSTWTSGSLLDVLDYAGIVYGQNGLPVTTVGTNGDGLLFGSSTGSLTAAQLGQIRFVDPVGADGTVYSGTYGATLNSLTGQVYAVVPEPGTLLGGALLLGAAAWRGRRRMRAFCSPAWA